MTIETNSAITPTGLLGHTALTAGKVTPAALRTLMADQYKGADIASAATTNLATATGDFVDVTGTTSITAFGTADAGIERTVRFTGALTLTYNATSLILPTAANITTTAGDVATFRSLGSGNWVCIRYQRASGLALVPGYPVPAAELTADGTDASTDAFTLKICNASSVITRTLPSSLPTIGSYIDYYNRSAYPVKISAGTDGIGTAGFDYVYVLQGNRLRFTYVSASDPKWICDGWQNQVAVVNAASSDWVTTNSSTLADVTNFNWRLGLSGDVWFFDIDVVYYSGATTTGPKFAMTLSASTNLHYYAEGAVAADGVSAKYHGTASTSGEAITFTGIESTSERYVGKLAGVATPSGSGALLQLQFASEVGSSNAVLRAHSNGRLRWVPRSN